MTQNGGATVFVYPPYTADARESRHLTSGTYRPGLVWGCREVSADGPQALRARRYYACRGLHERDKRTLGTARRVVDVPRVSAAHLQWPVYRGLNLLGHIATYDIGCTCIYRL